MRALRVLVAATVVLSLPCLPARADGGGWPDLARRIAGADPFAQLRVTAGAEPPGFVFPLPARPALLVLGSTWFASKKNAPPEIAHIYYAPTARTGPASAALYAQLDAAGYTRLPDNVYSSPFDSGDYGPARHMCPLDLRRPAIDVKIDTVDGLPAMDVQFHLHAASTSCRNAAVGRRLDSHAAKLTDIPGLTFRGRMVAVGAAPSSPFSTGTVRTALPARDAVAKIAERFVTNGWIARPAAVADTMITQRFELVEAPYRWEALLVFDRRADGVYDVLIAITDSAASAIH